MPSKCDHGGQPSYVMYVKLNPGIICDECEDADRKRKGVQDVWGTITTCSFQITGYRNKSASRQFSVLT